MAQFRFGDQHVGLSRRRFLEAASLLTVAAALPGGCTSGNDGEEVVTQLPYDPNQPWWLQSNFAPVFDEQVSQELEIRGSLPPELNGLYVRNGSNPASGDSLHWFFGDGMVHGVALEGGRALWYRNRFIETNLYLSGGGGGIGGADNASNVSAFNHQGRLFTLGEVGIPFELSTQDLSTLGANDFDDTVGQSFTAHPKEDPATGYLHSFGYWFMAPYLTYRVHDAEGSLVSSTEIGVSESTMMHSFAITEQDVVFWECPVGFDLNAAMEGVGLPYSWQEEYGTRIGILPLGGEGSEIRWVEIPNCYVFHEVNAYRDGDDVVVEVVRHPDMFNEGDELTRSAGSEVRRWRIDTSGEELAFSEETVGGGGLELPTHDRRFTGRSTRHAWFVSTREHPHLVDFAGVSHIDMQTGVTQTWDPGLALHANEAYFVPGGAGEGEGWLLTYVWNHMTDESVLAVLDALNVQAGPVAEVVLPRRVPFGFHGTWFPSA